MVVATFKAMLATIGNANLPLALFHDSVALSKPPHELLPFLLESASADSLIPEGFAVAPNASVAELRASQEHNKAFERMVAFIEATSMPAITLPSDLTPTNNPVDWRSARVVLDLTCIVRDTISVAAILHTKLLMPASASQSIAEDQLFTTIVWAFKFFGDLLADMEDLLSSAGAIGVETTGVKLKTPIAIVRSWRALMVIYRNKVNEVILSLFVQVLANYTQKCRDATPTWTACFDGDKFMPQMGKKVMAGRMSQIVASHNKLHSLMLRLNDAARTIALQPRLQDHETTCESVAIAFTTMAAASTAGTVALGIDILQLSDNASGSQKARAFIEKHKNSTTAAPIPDDFWSELMAMSSLAAADDLPDDAASTIAPSRMASAAAPAPSAASSSRAPSSVASSSAPGAPGAHPPRKAKQELGTSSRSVRPIGLQRMRQ